MHIRQVPCQIDTKSVALTWVMDLSYLYLFVVFYINKYKGSKRTSEKTKKIE